MFNSEIWNCKGSDMTDYSNFSGSWGWWFDGNNTCPEEKYITRTQHWNSEVWCNDMYKKTSVKYIKFNTFISVNDYLRQQLQLKVP